MAEQMKILWLSDIHYIQNDEHFTGILKSTDQCKKQMKLYYDSIKNHIKESQPTHIIISGDIAFSGSYNQLVSFHTDVLQEYLDESNCILNVIPGNHEFNRKPIEVIINKYDKKNKADAFFNSSLNTYKGRNKFLSKVKKLDFSKIKKKEIGIIQDSIHDGTNFINDWIKKKNHNLYDLCFHDYMKYYKEYVVKTWSKRTDGSLKCLSKESNNPNDQHGLYSVMVDHKFKCFFIGLNTAWYSWGEKTYEHLIKENILNKSFNEYGILTIDNDTISEVNSILEKFNFEMLKDEYFSAISFHHPMSWIAYDDKYNNSDLQNIILKNDINLSGHIHIQHSEPSLYKNKTWMFEAPQVCDYHLYERGKTKEKIDTSSTLGFSEFTLSPSRKKIRQTRYRLVNAFSSDKKLNPFGLATNKKFNWEKVMNPNGGQEADSFSYDLRNTKSIPNIFELKENINTRLSLYAKESEHCSKFVDFNNIYFDLESYVRSKHKSRDPITPLIISGAVNNSVVQCDDTLYIFPPLADSWDSHTNTMLGTVINDLSTKNDDTLLKIVILVTDYHFTYSMEGSLPDGSENDNQVKTSNQPTSQPMSYTQAKAQLTHSVTRFKSQLFEPKKNTDMSPLCKKVGIGFALLELIEYSDHLYKKKET